MRDLLKLCLHEKPVGKKEKSDLLDDILNGRAIEKKDMSTLSFLKELYEDPFSEKTNIPLDIDINYILQVIDDGDITFILNFFFNVIVLNDNKCTTKGLTETLKWLQTNTPTQVLICCKKDVTFPINTFLNKMLVKAQTILMKAVFSTSTLIIYLNTMFYNVCNCNNISSNVQGVTKYDTSYMQDVTRVIAQMYNEYMFDKIIMHKALNLFIVDIKTKQGCPQKFQGPIDGVIINDYMVMILSILMNQEDSLIKLSPSYPINTCILAVLGMISRFSLDGKQFNIEILLRSDINIEAFARLQLYLSNLTSSGKITREFIQHCAGASERNSDIMNTSADNFKDKFTKICGNPTILPIVTPDDKDKLSDKEIAIILWFSGITNFVDLIKQFRNILSICNRKTMENVDDFAIIYKMLSDVIIYLPNKALKTFGEFLDTLYPGIRMEYGGQELYDMLKFPIYSTTMFGLFNEPPNDPSGWTGLNVDEQTLRTYKCTRTELISIISIARRSNDVSFLPIAGVPSAGNIQNHFNNAKTYESIYHLIHNQLWHPQPEGDVSLRDAHNCVCGMPFCNPSPSSAKINKIYRSGVNCISQPNNKPRHVAMWAWFTSMNKAETLEDHIKAISFTLSQLNCQIKITTWAHVNGGVELWKTGDVIALKKNPYSNPFVTQLEWFCK